LDVLVPTEEVVVLTLLIVGHFNNILIEFGKHYKVSQSEMVPHKKCSVLEMFL
jgi:hypothetical protein